MILGKLDGLGSGEQAAVHGVDDWLGADLSSTKESAVETLDSVLATLDAVEFEVDIALGVWI